MTRAWACENCPFATTEEAKALAHYSESHKVRCYELDTDTTLGLHDKLVLHWLDMAVFVGVR